VFAAIAAFELKDADAILPRVIEGERALHADDVLMPRKLTVSMLLRVAACGGGGGGGDVVPGPMPRRRHGPAVAAHAR
jgi:hypothetical protein